MLFNSIEFLVFFPLVTLLYFALPYRARTALLLAASLLFYMAFVPAYVLILVFTIVIDYFAGIWIEATTGRHRKLALTASLVANIGVLGFFKYFNFFAATLNPLLSWGAYEAQIPLLSWVLPIGLSFHTFQAMSYTIEVYRGAQRAERDFMIYALYVMFYPQLVAGPIERPQNLLPQFRERHDFDYDRVVSGLRLMLWGFLKKVVIADRLAIAVNHVYSHPGEAQGFTALLAIYFFAFQIYCDFSGYSDIAIGAARVMGFRLMRNFDSPYLALSLSEFWQRWHISLSTWFKDYLYIPLGGNRVAPLRAKSNLLVVFLVSGLWHGAAWTFVLWGAAHGVMLIVSHQISRLGIVRGKRMRFVAWFVTFNCIAIAWVPFRAGNLHDTWQVLAGLSVWKNTWLLYSLSKLGLGNFELATTLLLIGLLLLVEWLDRNGALRVHFVRMPAWGRWASYYSAFVFLVLLGAFSAQQFIYSQF